MNYFLPQMPFMDTYYGAIALYIFALDFLIMKEKSLSLETMDGY